MGYRVERSSCGERQVVVSLLWIDRLLDRSAEAFHPIVYQRFLLGMQRVVIPTELAGGVLRFLATARDGQCKQSGDCHQDLAHVGDFLTAVWSLKGMMTFCL